MILNNEQLLEAIDKGDIVIKSRLGFDIKKQVSANSIDLTLSPILYEFNREWTVNTANGGFIDIDGDIVEPRRIDFRDKGLYLLKRSCMYLAVTNEFVYSSLYVPKCHDKSSLGRMFLPTHFNAGLGDLGFAGHYTLELLPTCDALVYENMMIAQMVFMLSSHSEHYSNVGRYNNDFMVYPEPMLSKGVKIL